MRWFKIGREKKQRATSAPNKLSEYVANNKRIVKNLCAFHWPITWLQDKNNIEHWPE